MKIKVNELTKQYKDKMALNNVSFELNEPIIYGLLGRNGAGKTTFMDILAGHQLPSSGDVKVNGSNPFDNREILEQICLIKEAENFQKELKIIDVLRIYSMVYPKWDKELAERLIEEYDLPIKSRVKTLSKGMVSALGVIVGLASNAPITIFDEPYIGMDAAARKKFYDTLLEEYEKSPRTFVFSTHLIDEVSLLFEEVIILREGEVILQESAESLRENTCAVTGEITEVEKFISDKRVLNKKKLANMMTAYIYSSKEEALQANLQVDGIPIQELMIYLTEKEGA